MILHTFVFDPHKCMVIAQDTRKTRKGRGSMARYLQLQATAQHQCHLSSVIWQCAYRRESDETRTHSVFWSLRKGSISSLVGLFKDPCMRRPGKSTRASLVSRFCMHKESARTSWFIFCHESTQASYSVALRSPSGGAEPVMDIIGACHTAVTVTLTGVAAMVSQGMYICTWPSASSTFLVGNKDAPTLLTV